MRTSRVQLQRSEARHSSTQQLADGHQGDFFVVMIPGDPLGSWVEHPSAVHHEDVMVMAVAKWHLDPPRSVRLPDHPVRLRVPIIEVTHDGNMVCAIRVADENN